MSGAPPRLQLVARTGHPSFLDLPWNEPLEGWESERLVDVVRGISRHVVRFVEYEGRLYALKELPSPLAWKEYRLLRALEDRAMPVVEVVGVADNRGDDLEAILITRHLEFSLPFRTLFARGGFRDLRHRLLDAAAELLVRLHLAGFFWGDFSLSNTLFRRDAGALAAYLVDAETGELHRALSDGQRAHDLEIAARELRRRAAGRGGRARPRARPAARGDRRPARHPLRGPLGRARARGGRSRPTSATASTTGSTGSTSSASTSRSSSSSATRTAST